MSRIFYLLCFVFLGAMLFLLPILLCPLCVSHADAASVTLAWDPNGETVLAGYRLYYGKASGIYEFVNDVGDQTTYSISGLKEGETYYFAVTAYNIFGYESEFSNELKYPEPFSVKLPLATGMNLAQDIPMKRGWQSIVLQTQYLQLEFVFLLAIRKVLLENA